jgi:hypothetical protein
VKLITRALLSVTLAALALPCAHAVAQSPARNAEALVAAMAPDSLALRSLQLSVENAVRAGTEPRRSLGCLDRVARHHFTAIYVDAASSSLTAEELSAATTFFESPTGRKLVAMGVYGLQSLRQRAPIEKQPELSDAERDEIVAFGRTSAGHKLLIQKVLGTPPVSQALLARARALLKPCLAG